LRQIDLNLLLVFDEILRQRSVTRAGDRLGLSQPAMSHALNRLRHQMKDQLFIRGAQGMMPTPRAERLAEPVRQALLMLNGALEEEDFRPEETRHRFTLAVNNYAAIALTGPIMGKARSMAPFLNLSFRPSGTLDVPAMLDRGELDFALLSYPPDLSRFSSHPLIDDDYVGVVRRGHPILDRPFDITAMTGLPYLHISSSGDNLSALDTELEKGLKRQISAEAPIWRPVPS
jgi:DNA-binding transcriptional LysR family regulator